MRTFEPGGLNAAPTTTPPVPPPAVAVPHGGLPLRPEPRWAAALAALASGGMYLAIPRSLNVGPPWLLLSAVVVLLIPTILTRRMGLLRVNHALGTLISLIMTVALIRVLVALVLALPAHLESPTALLRSGAIVWVANVLVFAGWYWRLDAGGPNARERRRAHTDGAFVFPQMNLTSHECRNWHPGFVDYLFLAFNTSTAFSPTDTAVLNRWAKGLMMLQSIISFTSGAILLARAVNIL